MTVNARTLGINKLRKGLLQAYRGCNGILNAGDIPLITLANELTGVRNGMRTAAAGLAELQALGLTNQQIRARFVAMIYPDDENIPNIGQAYNAAVAAHAALVVERRAVIHNAGAFLDDEASDLVLVNSTAASRPALNAAIQALRDALEPLVQ